MAFTVIPLTDVDFKSPIDETLMTTIKEDLDDLDQRASGGGGGGGIQFKVNGSLATLKALIDSDPSYGYTLDGSTVTPGQSYSRVRMFMKKNGTSGKTVIDIKSRTRVLHTITNIDHQMNLLTQAVGRVGSPLSTQAVTKRTPQINTLAINRVKSQENIDSVIIVEAGVSARYNLEGSLLDADWKVGKKVKVTGCTNGANNGEFTILEVNTDNHPCLILANTAAVQELASPGALNLQFFEYVFTNPVDTNGFKVGEFATLAGHTLAANNGLGEIVRINDGGNNLLFYNSTTGADTQGAPAGTADCTRWVYTFASAVNTGDYFIGDTMNASGHSSGANNGNFLIREVNDSGNNLVVTNLTGAVQAGAAGSVNTNRWTYTLDQDPSSKIQVGDKFRAAGHSSANNNGDWTIDEVNRFGLFNITIFNENGVTQAGVAGTVKSELVIVSFPADQSAAYVANKSLAYLRGTKDALNDGEFPVIEINRGGGANYNIVIKNIEATPQLFPMGQVDSVGRSLFLVRPQIDVTEGDLATGGSAATFDSFSAPANSIVTMDVIELPDGLPEDLSIDLS